MITYNSDVLSSAPKDDIRIDATRYVFGVGDFIESKDKWLLKSIGAEAGGLRLGHSHYEGCPTMWRTNYLLIRGLITPLELTYLPASGDMAVVATKQGSRDQTIGVTQAGVAVEQIYTVYPGGDVQLLQSDEYRRMGVVEISALQGIQIPNKSVEAWLTSPAYKLTTRFFPDFEKWSSGAEAFPKLLSDYVTCIQNAKIENEKHETTQAEMLESARLFRTYALDQIEKNRQAIEDTRSKDTGGFRQGWAGRTRLFAEQLGIKLEKEEEIVNNVPKEDKELKEREIKAQEEANELKRLELEMLKAKYEAEKLAAEKAEKTGKK